MNSETFYKIEPNLNEIDNAALLEFLSKRNYTLSSISGEFIYIGCQLENIYEGREPIELTRELTYSAEDSLSDSISVIDASKILSQAVLNLQPKFSLSIIDYYLFPKNPDSLYQDLFFSIFSQVLSNIQKLTIYTPKNHNRKLKSEILNKITSTYNVQIDIVETSVFHDRFWIVDDSRGLYVGTSLNGIGKRYSIFDILKKNDISEIVTRCKNL